MLVKAFVTGRPDSAGSTSSAIDAIPIATRAGTSGWFARSHRAHLPFQDAAVAPPNLRAGKIQRLDLIPKHDSRAKSSTIFLLLNSAAHFKELCDSF
jgi:hypothetical protein